MFNTFFKFELKSWLRSPMPWIFLFIFGLLCFFGTISDEVTIGGSYGNVWKNAPFVAQNWYAVFSLMSILLVTAFLNTAAIRDFERNMSQIVFSKPISKASYYFGHFWGAIVIAIIPMLGVSLGMWTGVLANSMADWLDADRFGPFEIQGHLMGLLVFAIPNMLFVGGILYAVAINTRSTLYSFVAATALLVGYIVAGNMMRDMENEQLSMMLDPFGFRAFGAVLWSLDICHSIGQHRGPFGLRLDHLADCGQSTRGHCLHSFAFLVGLVAVVASQYDTRQACSTERLFRAALKPRTT